MNRFNLTFSGEIQAGQDPTAVKLRFGKMFAIDDPIRLERFFSGQTVILRRNLERKDAAQYYHELHQLGAVAALVKVADSEATDSAANGSPPPRKTGGRATVSAKRGSAKRSLQPPQPAALDQTWAVGSRVATPNKTDLAVKIRARKEESQRQATEKAAQEKAALEAQQRQAAEISARQAAEKKLREEEETAQRQALAAEAKRKAVEEAARRKALQEQARLRAEEEARRKAELEELKRREAEEAIRLYAEQEEMKRREAEEAARLQTELAEIKRQEAEEAARIKAEALRREAEAQRQSAEHRRAAAEQLAAQRALRREEKRKLVAQQAAALAQSTNLKPPKTRVRTNLEVPQRKSIPTAVGTPAPRQRQPGEPNLYNLRPFRNTEEVRARATRAPQRMRQGYALGALALAILFIAGGSFLRQPTNPGISGADAIVIDPKSAPLLLAGDQLLFHDRAGVSTKAVPLSDLGVSALFPPLEFDSSGALLALGQLSGDSAYAASRRSPQLLRCALGPSPCEYVSSQLQDSAISTFVIHPLDGSLILADHVAGELLKINHAGEIVARATVAIPAQPVLRLQGGLLMMNSAAGPAIGVYRYEDNAFGQQLDEILLLPPSAQQTAQSRVGDFLWSSGAWWATLRNPESGDVGLYRFDEKWSYVDEVELPAATGPLQLVSWGEKTLVNDPLRPAALRFNALREVEAPFASAPLADLVAAGQRRATLSTTAWRVGLLLCALAAVLGFGIGYLQKLRALVYKSHRERGAEPVDDYVDALHWIDPVQNRLAMLRSRSISYGLLVLGILLLAIALSVTVWQLAALVLALSGPAIALLLLMRYPVEHVGVMQDKVLLVDHRGMYHFAGGSGVQHHGPFLLIDDVVVFTGSRLLPAFASPQLQKLVMPLASGGVKVDRKTLMVKLLQCRHPFAQGACVMLAATAAAALLLSLHGIF